MTMLEAENLSAGFGRNDVVKQVSLRVESGELVAVLGANGCGKTTLLKALCGLLPSRGKVLLQGQDIRSLTPRERAKRSRYIPQKSGIDIDIPVLDVVLMGFNPHLRLLENPGESMKAAAAEALSAVGLGHRAHDNFQILSEGQKQLCILARTMLPGSGMLFLDEPESALDFSGRYSLLETVKNWLSGTESGALVTLHDPQLALNCCDRILLMKNGSLTACLTPAQEPKEAMEEKLAEVFGPLSLHTCPDRAGRVRTVLLKEEM